MTSTPPPGDGGVLGEGLPWLAPDATTAPEAEPESEAHDALPSPEPELEVAAPRHAVATTPARYEGHSCVLCGAGIELGTGIYPLQRTAEAARAPHWAHGSCAPLQEAAAFRAAYAIPECRHWSRRGRCAMRDAGACAFLHSALPAGGPQRRTKWGGRRRDVRNDFKATAFRIWLTQTFGPSVPVGRHSHTESSKTPLPRYPKLARAVVPPPSGSEQRRAAVPAQGEVAHSTAGRVWI